MAVADGTSCAAANLRRTDVYGATVATPLEQFVPVAARLSTDVTPIVDAMVIAQAKTDRRAVIRRMLPSFSRRAEKQAPTPALSEVGIAAPRMGRVVKAKAAPAVVRHKATAIRAASRTSSVFLRALPAYRVARTSASLTAADVLTAFLGGAQEMAEAIQRVSPVRRFCPELVAFGETSSFETYVGDEMRPPRARVGDSVATANTAFSPRPRLTATQVAGIGASCGDKPAKRSPIASLPRIGVTGRVGVLPLVVEGLEKGVHAIREAILAMTTMASPSQVVLNERATAAIGLVGRPIGVPACATADGVASPFYPSRNVTLTASRICACRPRPAMPQVAFQAF